MDSMSATREMKYGSQIDEDCSHNDLQNQRCLDQGMANLHLLVGQRLVRRVRCAPSVQSLDDARDETKRCQHTARVKRRVVGYVVEDPTEYVVVLQLQQGSVPVSEGI